MSFTHSTTTWLTRKTGLVALSYATVVILITEGSAMLEEFMTVLFIDSSVSERMRILASYLIGGAILLICAIIVDWLDNQYHHTVDGPNVITIFTRSTLIPFTLPRIAVDVSLLRLIVLVGALQLSQAFYNYGHFLVFKDWAPANRDYMFVVSLLVWFGALLVAAYISYHLIPKLNKHVPSDHVSSGLFVNVDKRGACTTTVVRIQGEHVPL